MTAEVMERFSMDRLGFVVLFTLDRHNGLAARDIVQATGFPKNSISRSISGLKKRKFVIDRIDLNDKRSKKREITESGKRIVGNILPMKGYIRIARAKSRKDVQSSDIPGGFPTESGPTARWPCHCRF